MRIIAILLSIQLICQLLNAQDNYNGKVNLKKDKSSFSLVSATDSFNVMIGKKSLTFDNRNDFTLIKIKKNNYNLVKNGESILIRDSRDKIEYSSGLILYPASKKNKQIIINDKDGKTGLDATLNLRRGISDFNIAIFDNKHKAELLSYAANYLYINSKNLKEANNTQYLYFYLF